MDTAARFGGDEFAVVLPEMGDAAAWHVARRVAERVARDGGKPPLSVSVAVVPARRGHLGGAPLRSGRIPVRE
jgi:GGDEF domain-containing protein